MDVISPDDESCIVAVAKTAQTGTWALSNVSANDVGQAANGTNVLSRLPLWGLFSSSGQTQETKLIYNIIIHYDIRIFSGATTTLQIKRRSNHLFVITSYKSCC